MISKNISLACWIIFFSIISFSCKKTLDAKPDLQQVVPENLADVQALLDHSSTYIAPAADEASADNYYITTASYNGLFSSNNRAIYTWEKGNLFSSVTSDWAVSYRHVYYCNVALEALEKMPTTGTTEWQNLKGQALFKRGKIFWNILNVWSLAYDANTSRTDLGIPLRLHSDFNEVAVRASVKESYDRIITDLNESLGLLPSVSAHPVRPSKPAAYAMLSRVYLSMRNYHQAKLYADSALSITNILLDYNTVNSSPSFPFTNPTPETIFGSVSTNALLTQTNARVDTILYAMYGPNDLRKTLFFRSLGNNEYTFRNSYANSEGHFSGLTTSELYLTRAECFARDGKVTEALADLNTLLRKRFKTGTFVPVTAINAGEALAKILIERRKELVMRFTRWMDIKRFNKDGAGIVLKRIINGQTYVLPPNDLRYALALPEEVVEISGVPQNPR